MNLNDETTSPDLGHHMSKIMEASKVMVCLENSED